MYKLENRHDSAAYYIERRANRDTTNAEWQFDAGQYFIYHNLPKAKIYYERSLSLYQDLAAANPEIYELEVATTQNNLALLYSHFPKFDDDLLNIIYSYQIEESEKMFLSALEILQRLAASNPEKYEQGVAKTMANLAFLYRQANRYEESEKMFLSALEIEQRLAASNPEEYELEVATTQNNLALLYDDTKMFEEAEKLYLSALETYQRHAASNPKAYEPLVANTQYNLARLYMETQRFGEAEKLLLSALDIHQRFVAINPDSYESRLAYTQRELAKTRDQLAQKQNNLANEYFRTNRHEEAEKIYFSALEIYQRLAVSYPEEFDTKVASSLGAIAYNSIFMRKFKDAEKYAREGLKKDSQKHWIATNLAAALLFQGKYDEAEAIYRQYKDELKDFFLDDFKQFAEAGVIPPECEAEVEKIKRLLEE